LDGSGVWTALGPSLLKRSHRTASSASRRDEEDDMPKLPDVHHQPTPQSHPPAPTPQGTDYLGIFYRAYYAAHSTDPVMLASGKEATPSASGVSRLPGDTPEAKAAYLIAYLNAGAALGCSGADMISARHDSDLNLARPKIRGVFVTDPSLAARAAFGAGGIGIDLIKYSFANELAADPNWNFFKAKVYVDFWSRYGMPAA
jgi:hypothetical protein